MDVRRLMSRLWGDNFYNPTTKKWQKEKEDGDGTVRSANSYWTTDPIFKTFDAIMNFLKDEIRNLLDKLGIKLRPADEAKTGKDLLKIVMKNWLPAG